MIIYGEHILVFITVLSPVWAYVIWRIDTNHREWYILGELAIYATTVTIAYNTIRVPKVTFWLHYYGLFGMIYLLVLGYKMGFKHFNKALAFSIMMLFIAGDLWEIPEFIYDLVFHHNLAPPLMWTISHIRRVYTFATFVLFTILSKFKFNAYNLGVLGIATAWTFVLLLPGTFLYQEEIVRIFYLAAFGVFAYLGVDKHGLALVDSQP